VFEIAKTPLGELLYVLPGVFIMICIPIFHKSNKRSAQRDSGCMTTIFPYFAFIFAFVWVIISSIQLISGHSSLRSDYDHGRFKVVKGLVKNFNSGRRLESFTVRGVKFEYAYYTVTPGFNRMASRGGPMREGLPVRMSYIDDFIVKLEIKKGSIK
jgi:hypothetical protein